MPRVGRTEARTAPRGTPRATPRTVVESESPASSMTSLTTKSTKDEILAAAEMLNVNLADLSNYRLNATKETAFARIREAEQSTSPRATPRTVVDSETPVGTRLGRGAARVVDLSDTTPMPQPNFATPMDIDSAFTQATKLLSDRPDAVKVGSKLREMMKTCERIIAGSETAKFVERQMPDPNNPGYGFDPASEQTITKTAALSNKIVIASFYTTVLDAVAMLLEVYGYSHLRIDGKTKQRARDANVEAFKNNDSPKFFLISVKAGGAGINLQSAKVIMILDPWWNPAKVRQAQDRIWRLRSPHDAVYVYNWFAEGVDERVLEICTEKAELYGETLGLVEDIVTMASLSGAGSARRSDRALDLYQDLKEAGFNTSCGEYPMPHQKVGIKWMQRQERGQNPEAPGVTGGILADDMGLGKTLQMLSLVMLDCKASGTRKPTLVAVPKAVFGSWEGDAKKYFGESLTVHRWHEAKGRISANDITELAQAGPLIILTNERHLASHATVGMLGSVQWRRVVLDESQRINSKRNDLEAACKLAADYKWSLSGTPIENEVQDFDAHLKLIGAGDKLDAPMMKHQEKLSGVCLRRTKLGVKHNFSTSDSGKTLQANLPKCFLWVGSGTDTSKPTFQMDADELEKYMAATAHVTNAFAKRINGSIKTAVPSYGEGAGPSNMTKAEVKKLDDKLKGKNEDAEARPSPRSHGYSTRSKSRA